MTHPSIPSPVPLRVPRSCCGVPCRWLALAALWWLVPFAADAARGQQTTPLQHLWEVQPDFGEIWLIQSTVRSKFINIELLASDRAQERLDTAREICMNYDRPGFQNATRAMELIVASLSRSDESISVRRAMVSAACALDDGSNAGALWRACREDPLLALRVQKRLVDWKSPVAIDAWRQTMRDPAASEDQIALAIQGVGAVADPQDQALLMQQLESETSTAPLRVLAAEALGSMQRSGLSSLAAKYLRSDHPDRDLIAVHLVRQHADDEAVRILRHFHESGSPPAKRLAAAALARAAPAQARELESQWMVDSDVFFRRLALDFAMGQGPAQGIAAAKHALQDVDLSTRQTARLALRSYASDGHRAAVNDCLDHGISSDAWQGIEQAAILAVELQDRSRCARLLELIDHPQPEVHMHAAWALMELSEPGPIVEQIYARAADKTAGLERGDAKLGKSGSIQLSFLLETLGKHRFAPAYPMLAKYIPKNDFKMGNLTRSSAIWAIAQIRSNDDDPDLRAQLVERIKDMPPDKPENYLVRFACIVALGEFAFRDSLEVIDAYGGKPPSALGAASQWARERIGKSGK